MPILIDQGSSFLLQTLHCTNTPPTSPCHLQCLTVASNASQTLSTCPKQLCECCAFLHLHSSCLPCLIFKRWQEAGLSGAQSIAAHQTTSCPAVSPMVIPSITPVVLPPAGNPPTAFPLTHTTPFIPPPTPTFTWSYPNASTQALKFKIIQSKAQKKKGATEDDPMVIDELGSEPEEEPIPPARVGRGQSP